MGDDLYKLRIEEAPVQSLEEFLIKYLLIILYYNNNNNK